jgi:dephospho-CoA kinase
MLIVGLTGSIGMGKSTVAARFREHGIPVFDADAEVHKLYAGPAAARIEQAFPGTTVSGAVDRAKLAAALAGDTKAFARLEAIVHPLVWAAERAFVKAAALHGASIALLEIPLLFEGGSDSKMDAVIAVSAPAETQRLRVLARPGMTSERLDVLLERQMPDAEKRQRAQFVVDTNGTIAHSQAQTDAIVARLKQHPAEAYQRFWA